MNDPHVAELIYRVRHRDTIDYSKARPLVFEMPLFRVAVRSREAHFEMLEHYASEADARKVVERYIGSWEFDVCLKHGAGYFNLEFNRSKIIDRSPSVAVPGVLVDGGAVYWEFRTSKPRVRLSPSGFPSPPEVIYDCDSPDVQTLVKRFEGYRQGRERLPSFAYFCVTVLEHAVGPGKQQRRRAATQYRVAQQVLSRIGSLCDEKGGMEARKGKAVDEPLTDQERDFLERATVALIRRVAEHYAGATALGTITLADLSECDAS